MPEPIFNLQGHLPSTFIVRNGKGTIESITHFSHSIYSFLLLHSFQILVEFHAPPQIQIGQSFWHEQCIIRFLSLVAVFTCQFLTQPFADMLEVCAYSFLNFDHCGRDEFISYTTTVSKWFFVVFCNEPTLCIQKHQRLKNLYIVLCINMTIRLFSFHSS